MRDHHRNQEKLIFFFFMICPSVGSKQGMELQLQYMTAVVICAEFLCSDLAFQNFCWITQISSVPCGVSIYYKCYLNQLREAAICMKNLHVYCFSLIMVSF